MGQYYTNYPADLLPDLKERLIRDNVVHIVIGKKDEGGNVEEINCRLWGGSTKKGKSTTKLWGPLVRIGGYGLNWNTKTIHWIGLDIDAKNNGPIQKDGDKDALVEALDKLGYCQIRNSSSGKGLHIYVDLQNPISGVDSERGYASYRNALASHIERDLANGGYTHLPVFDRVGTVLYMWKRGAGPDAYKLLRPARQSFQFELKPESNKKSVRTEGPGWPATLEDAIIKGWTRLQYEFVDYLAKNDPAFSLAGDAGPICHAHTSVVSRAIQHLNIPGLWSTNTPATDLSHHNCYITILPSSGIIRVWRAGNGAANESAAWLTVNDRTVAVLNGVARSKLCMLSGLQAPTRTDRARGPISKDVLKQLNIPYSESWNDIEANIQVNNSKVKFTVKGKRDPQPGWMVGATQMSYTLDIDDNLHSRKVEEISGRTETDAVEVQYTRDDSNEMVAYFKNERGEWQHSTNDSLLRAYLQERYKMTSAELKRCLAMKYANDVMLRVEMPCVPFGVYEYEKRTYWNVPPTDFAFPKPEQTTLVKSRISTIHPSLRELAAQCPGWFALYNHIFANLQVPQELKDSYSIETGADYGLLWAAYKIRDPLNIVPILVLTGPPETGKTFFADSFRHFFTGRGAYKITNALVSNYPDWLGVVVGSSDDLDEYSATTVTRLKNIGSGDRLEVNPKFKRPSLVGGYLSLIMNMKDLSTFPTEYLKDRCTFVPVSPIEDVPFDPEFFITGCRNVYDKRIHARIPNVHWALNQQAESFFHYLCSIELPTPVRRYALPIAGKPE